MGIQRRKQPRALTLTLPDNQQPFLVLNGRKYTLRNFSEGGIGLWLIPPTPSGLQTGTELKAEIVVGEKSFKTTLQVMHISERGVGLKIEKETQGLKDALKSLLVPTTLASKVVESKLSHKEDPEMHLPRLWYTNVDGVQLLVWYQAGPDTIHALQVVWDGKWVFREFMKKSETGFVKEGIDLGRGGKLSKLELKEITAEPDPKILQEASQFLASLPQPLPGYLLWQFLESGEQVTLPKQVIHPPKAA